jgi:hypothetical protein
MKHCFLAMFHKETLFPSKVSPWWANLETLLAMFPEGGQTMKYCFLAMFSKGGQTGNTISQLSFLLVGKP